MVFIMVALLLRFNFWYDAMRKTWTKI